MFQACVRAGLKNTLGETVMLTVVPLLKQSLEAYADKPDEFHHDLTFFFGYGALTLERMIAKELFQSMNLQYPIGQELDFETCIRLAKKDLLATRKTAKHN
jgi:hypothetical protein